MSAEIADYFDEKRARETPEQRLERWRKLAVCIRSDQVPAERIYAMWREEPGFKEWYRREFLSG